MSGLPKCWSDHPDCFAGVNGKCVLLTHNFTEAFGQIYISAPTKFKDRDCPFYKTAEAAGGTFEELCEKYPLNPGKGEAK